MTGNKTLLTLMVLACLGATSVAQEVGDKMPKIQTEEFTNTKIKSVGDFKGKLMLVEFFAFW